MTELDKLKDLLQSFGVEFGTSHNQEARWVDIPVGEMEFSFRFSHDGSFLDIQWAQA